MNISIDRCKQDSPSPACEGSLGASLVLSKGVALFRGGGGEAGFGAGMFTGTEAGALADEDAGDSAAAAGIASGPGGVSGA